MTSSTNIQRGLDTPVLVYSLLQGHPASTACEQFIRAHGGWLAAWESAHLPPKGSVRMLRRIFEWLNQSYGQAAQDFWSQTGGANHLP